MASILKAWVTELGLRHQGVLLTAVRGCDALPKEHISKTLTRAFRCEILNSHCGDPRHSKSFIEHFEEEELDEIMQKFCSDLDVYPLHYVLHLAHAAEIVGFHHPQMDSGSAWLRLYSRICSKLHMRPETKAELDARLEAPEHEFQQAQKE